jgi:hypothetical protein
MRFTNTKVFLANRGIMHWGNYAELVRFEAHDTGIAANMFGQVWGNQMLVNCRSNNAQPFGNGCPTASKNWWSCHQRDYIFWQEFAGFQWYDVGQQHIITNSTFRNCGNNWKLCMSTPCRGHPWTLLTHSDQFVPQVMQATSGIRYENANVSALWRFSNRNRGATVSGMLQNWLDMDGSASLKSSQQIMGSAWANDWWNLSNQTCSRSQAETDMWLCSTNRQTLPPAYSTSLYLSIYPNQFDQYVGNTECGNGQNIPCTPIGYVTHLARTPMRPGGMPITLNPRITGPVDIRLGSGWYVRYLQGKHDLTPGAPKSFTINNIQLPSQNQTLIMAFPYPNFTSFTVRAISWCWGLTCYHQYSRAFSLQQLYFNTSGDLYFFDNNTSVLYLQVISHSDRNLAVNGFNRSIPLTTNFTRDGITIPGMTQSFKIEVISNCTTNGTFCILNDNFDNVRTAKSVSEFIANSTTTNSTFGGIETLTRVPSSSARYRLSVFLLIIYCHFLIQ